MSSAIRRRAVFFMVGLASLGVAACATILGFEDLTREAQDGGLDVDAAHQADAAPDVNSTDAGIMCDPDAQFTVHPVRGLSNLGWPVLRSATLSKDERQIFFYGTPDGGDLHIYTAKRKEPNDTFVEIRELPNKINASPAQAVTPSLSLSETKLFFARETVTKSFRSRELFVASRPFPTQDNFDVVERLVNVNYDGEADQDPFLSADGGELWFTSYRDAGPDSRAQLFQARASGNSFGSAKRIESPNKNSSRNESPVLSIDGKTLFYSGDGDGSHDSNDIFEARRTTENGLFTVHRRVEEFGTEPNRLEYPSWLSPNGCHLYMHVTSDATGQGTIFYGDRTPKP